MSGIKRIIIIAGIFGLLVLGVAGLAIWLLRLPAQDHVVAAYTTGLRNRMHSQEHNVRLALQALDGQEILPGKVFSFNKTVGPLTLDRGYVKAPVSFSGNKMLDWGGGVCQASTTLYNAALLAGLPILERSRHHWPATYAPAGQDAAVAYPSIDLAFRNSLAAPIRIRARVKGESVVVELWSRAAAPKVHIEREMLAVTPAAVLVRRHSTQTRHPSVHGQPGYQVVVYRNFLTAKPRRELVSRDTYPPQNRVVWE
jgi:vancomycin resistance protein VanW